MLAHDKDILLPCITTIRYGNELGGATRRRLIPVLPGRRVMFVKIKMQGNALYRFLNGLSD
jgi:hypothetical protein